MKNKKLLIIVLALFAFGCKEGNVNQDSSSLIVSNVIIGNDDRRYVYDDYSIHGKRTALLTAQSPYRDAVDDIKNCTATYISSHFLITSAHCVYDVKNNVFLENMYITPFVQNDSRKNWANQFIDRVYYLPEYLNARNSYDSLKSKKYDLALIRVYNPKGKKTNDVGWNVTYHLSHKTEKNKYEKNSNGIFKDHKVLVHSYPGDKDNKLVYQDNCTMTYDSEFLYKHNCDTVGGSSGSAMKARHPKYSPKVENQNDSYYIVGVHSGVDEFGNNYATRLTYERWKTIKHIIKGLPMKDVYDPNMFSYKDIKMQIFNDLEFKNNCNDIVHYAVRYKNIYTGWMTLGYFTLKPGEYHSSNVMTDLDYYYLFAINKYGEPQTWGSEKKTFKIHNDTRTFVKKYLNAKVSNDFIHTFCN